MNNNEEKEATVRRMLDSRFGGVLGAAHDADLRIVLNALTDAEADAQRLAERVRSVRLMFETAGMHRTAEDMDDVLDQHDARVSKRAAT